MSKDSLLNREFTEREVTRMRNLITKKYGEKTTVSAGYESTIVRKEGDIWEENGKIKGYSPLEINPALKWITNFRSEVQGLSKLPERGDILCITKSMKDIAVYHEIGIPAIAPQSEHILLSEEVMADLYSRFDFIFTNFDNDETGKALAEKYDEKYGLHSVFLDEFKDPFEYSQNKGLKEFENEINKKR